MQSYGTLASALSFVLVLGCATERSVPEGESDESAIDRIMAAGVVRVGWVRFDPCAFPDPRSGELKGIFVDAVRAIAEDLKVKVEFRETTLSTFSAALEAEEFDFSIGPTFITPTRSLSVIFTRPLLGLGNSGLVKDSAQSSLDTLPELNQPNVRIAVLQGQAMERFARVHLPQAKLVVLAGSDLTAPLAAVEAGRAEIGLSNTLTVQRYAKGRAGLAVVLSEGTAIETLGLAWVVPRGDQRLLTFLSNSLDWLVVSGRLEEIVGAYPERLSKLF
jgi:polar amino acid transport system substrate-binding protein